jgi:hypothetical protein
VVVGRSFTTETQRTQRLHREDVKIRHYRPLQSYEGIGNEATHETKLRIMVHDPILPFAQA